MNLVIGPKKQMLCMISALPAGANWQWCYLGADLVAKNKISGLLPLDKRKHYGAELAMLSRALKAEFLEWTAGLNKEHQQQLKWWATRFSSRSPLQTDIFLLYCYYHLLSGWVAQGSLGTATLYVIIEDEYLQAQAVADLSGQGCRVLPLGTRRLVARVSLSVGEARQRVLLIKALLVNSIRCSALKIRYRSKFKELRSFRPEVITYTWLEKRSFQAGEFKDAYLGALKEWYEKLGKTVLVAAQIMVQPSVQQAALAADAKIFMPIFSLRLSDWLLVLFSSPPKPGPSKKFGYLLEREYRRERAEHYFYYHLLEHYAYRRFFAANRSAKLLIYPFENQPWEHLMLAVVKAANFGCKTAGYQHASIPTMMINFFLGQKEGGYYPAPNYIVANGEYHRQLLASAGFSSATVLNGGSLRFAVRSPERRAKTNGSGQVKRILYLLTAAPSYSLELIYSLGDILGPGGSYRVSVKPHPDLYDKKIKRALAKFPGTQVAWGRPMSEVLAETDLVVHSGTTAALEAINSGIPAFKYGTELIDLDILEDLKVEQFHTDRNGKIDLGAIELEREMALPRDNIIGEPFNEVSWRSVI